MRTILITLLFMLAGCDGLLFDSAGPYKDLSEKYPKKNESDVKVIEPERLVVYSQNYRKTVNFNSVSKIQLTNTAIFISINNNIYDPIEIPSTSISGCTCTWFDKDNWSTVLILGKDRTDINIHLSEEAKNWCYENNMPVISGKHERDWKYNKKPLPSFSDYQQIDRIEFDKQFKRSCMGY